MKKNGYLFIVVALTAIALIGFHATAFGATTNCSSTCQTCHTAINTPLYHPAAAGSGTPVMCIECHQQNRTMCNSSSPIHSGAEIDIAAIACLGCHGPATCGDEFSVAKLEQIAPFMHSISHPVSSSTPSTCLTCHTYADLHAATTPSPNLETACGQCHGTVAGGAASTHNGAPYISAANIGQYASVMHGGVPEGGPESPPAIDPLAVCIDPLVAGGTLSIASGSGTVGSCSTDGTTCNIDVGGTVEIDKDASSDVIVNTVWWGDGSGLDTTGITHSYNNIGKFQVIQTVRNACGFTAQKVMIVNVSGGDGKGTMTLSATTTVAGRKLSYSVLNSSDVSITNGTIAVAGAAKVITLDEGSDYSVKIGYEAVQPYTDPVTYRSCNMHANGTAVAKCSHPAYTTSATCVAAGHAWQITGQLITPVAVTTGSNTAVTLTGCN